MKQITIVLALLLISSIAFSQQRKSVLLSVSGDVYRTDNTGLFGKAQLGTELNYFVANRLTVSGGYEFWSAGQNPVTFGMRLYPINATFVRVRGLIMNSPDVSLGIGAVNSLDNNWKIELIGDYFYNLGGFAFRLGVCKEF